MAPSELLKLFEDVEVKILYEKKDEQLYPRGSIVFKECPDLKSAPSPLLQASIECGITPTPNSSPTSSRENSISASESDENTTAVKKGKEYLAKCNTLCIYTECNYTVYLH